LFGIGLLQGGCRGFGGYLELGSMELVREEEEEEEEVEEEEVEEVEEEVVVVVGGEGTYRLF